VQVTFDPSNTADCARVLRMISPTPATPAAPPTRRVGLPSAPSLPPRLQRHTWVLNHIIEHGGRGRHVELDMEGARIGERWQYARRKLKAANIIRSTGEWGYYEIVPEAEWRV